MGPTLTAFAASLRGMKFVEAASAALRPARRHEAPKRGQARAHERAPGL